MLYCSKWKVGGRLSYLWCRGSCGSTAAWRSCRRSPADTTARHQCRTCRSRLHCPQTGTTTEMRHINVTEGFHCYKRRTTGAGAESCGCSFLGVQCVCLRHLRTIAFTVSYRGEWRLYFLWWCVFLVWSKCFLLSFTQFFTWFNTWKWKLSWFFFFFLAFS